MLRRQPACNYGPDDMDHLLRGQVKPVRQHRNGGRLLVGGPVLSAQKLHLPVALIAELYPGEGVDAVIYAGVHRGKAAEHL